MTDYSAALNGWVESVLHGGFHDHDQRVSNTLEWIPSFIVRRFKLFLLEERLRNDIENVDLYDEAVEAMLRVQEDMHDAKLEGHDIPPPIPTRKPCSMDDRVCKILKWQRLSVPCHEHWEKAWGDLDIADEISDLISDLEDELSNDVSFVRSIIEFQAILRKMEKIGIPINKVNPPVEGIEWLYAAFLVMES